VNRERRRSPVYQPARVGYAGYTIHLTADGRRTLCGRPVAELLDWTIRNILRTKCRSCVDIAWKRQRHSERIEQSERSPR